MKSAILLGFVAFVVAVTAEVEVLDDANFKEKLASKPFAMIDFYSPECPFCRRIEPAYAKAETQLHASQPSVLVGKVDCTSNATKATCADYKIRFVPWIVAFREGKQVMNYTSRPRDAASFIQFAGDAVDNKDTSIQQQDLSFPKAQPPNTCDQGANQAMPAAVQVPGELSVTDLTDATFSNFVRGSPYVIVDYYTPWCSDCKHLKPLYDEAASHLQKTTPSIKFARVDCNQGNTATVLTCGASKLKFYPWVVLYHDGKPLSNYEQENVPNTDAIYDFINRDTNILGGVINLDDSNFEPTITRLPFVAVNFYAPWCFYCKKMTPIYKEVAKVELTAHPDVRLYEVDCSATNPKTRRTCSKNDISFLPTLKIFQSGQFVKEYEGDKTNKEGILGFIDDAVNKQQAMRRTMESKNKKDDDKEGSADDKDDKKDKKSHKKSKTSKDKNTKKVSKKKEKSIASKAARILKKVFKQFKKKSHDKKSKSKHDDDDDEEDYDDDSDTKKGDKWQQIAKDIHRIAKDMHKLTKEFHKAMNKQPAVDRLFKAFHKLVKTKDEDEDDF